MTDARRIRPTAVLGLALLVCALLSLGQLQLDHDWGDDFAAYLMQARSIVTGTTADYVRRSSFTVEHSFAGLGPVTYPWGVPILLAPVVSVFGTEPVTSKMVGVAALLGFVPAFAALARRRLGAWEAVALAATIGVAPCYVGATNRILSDLPFLAVSTVALDVIAGPWLGGSAAPMSVGRSVAAGLAILFATVCRPNGVLLWIPMLAVQLLQAVRASRQGALDRRHLLQLVVPVGTFLAGWVLQSRLLPSLPYPPLLSRVTVGTIRDHLRAYATSPAEVFALERSIGPTGAALFSLAAWGFFFLRMVRRDARVTPLVLYALATVVLYVIHPDRNLRYLLPALPILFLVACDGVRELGSLCGPTWHRSRWAVVACAWIALGALAISVDLRAVGDNLRDGFRLPGIDRGPFTTESARMFEWVRENTRQDAVVVFRKPRALRLLTGRNAFATADCESLGAGDWYVMTADRAPDGSQLSVDRLRACALKSPGVEASEVADLPGYRIYRIERRTIVPPGN